uniref:START domain-containing protein n=1 Tax=Oryza meridionalis TaxID=40149 RepID=A0A0E0CMA8_9ORYZ
MRRQARLRGRASASAAAAASGGSGCGRSRGRGGQAAGEKAGGEKGGERPPGRRRLRERRRSARWRRRERWRGGAPRREVGASAGEAAGRIGGSKGRGRRPRWTGDGGDEPGLCWPRWTLTSSAVARRGDELIRLAQAGEHIWSKSPGGGVSGGDARETLSVDTYNSIFSKPGGSYHAPSINVEGSRESGLVLMSTVALADVCMDTNKWMEFFPSIVSKAHTIEQGLWAIADVSVDLQRAGGRGRRADRPHRRDKWERRPAGDGERRRASRHHRRPVRARLPPAGGGDVQGVEGKAGGRRPPTPTSRHTPATWSSPAARPSPLSPAVLRPQPSAVSTAPLSRVHSPTHYFDARLRFACSPPPLRCRTGPPPRSPVVGIDLVLLDTIRRPEVEKREEEKKREEKKKRMSNQAKLLSRELYCRGNSVLTDACAAVDTARDREGGGDRGPNRFSKKPDWVIVDFAHNWLPPIANEHQVPCAFFSIFSTKTLMFVGPKAARTEKDKGGGRRPARKRAGGGNHWTGRSASVHGEGGGGEVDEHAWRGRRRETGEHAQRGRERGGPQPVDLPVPLASTPRVFVRHTVGRVPIPTTATPSTSVLPVNFLLLLGSILPGAPTMPWPQCRVTSP